MKFIVDYTDEVGEAYYQIDYDRDDWFTERMMVFEIKTSIMKQVFNRMYTHAIHRQFRQLFGAKKGRE